ncbi:MAG: transposase [Pseudonocardiaceae bacterium]
MVTAVSSQVEVGGAGTVAQAGVVLPRLLADRLGLTGELAEVVARAGFVPLRHRGRVLVDTICALAAGATCLSDVEAMTAQEEIFGPGGGASDSTLLRALDELADRLGSDGLPGRRLARATARARAKAWTGLVARYGSLPAVPVAGRDLVRPATAAQQRARPVLVIRLDATLIEAASPKARAAGHYKGGYDFHPLGSWCTNTGEAMAVMLRPGNAGSFTAADHIAVLTATFGQIPAGWRSNVLVTIDGAGASHDVIDHLTGLNTAAAHGKRGHRVEYSIGWPLDERTLAGIEQLRQTDWGDALDPDGEIDPQAQVADLTGILRHGPGGDRLAGWPPDLRVIARRTPRPATKPAKLGEHPNFEYGAFVTNTAVGQVQFLDARHRTQAHVEDRMSEDLLDDGVRAVGQIGVDGGQHGVGEQAVVAPRREQLVLPGWGFAADPAHHQPGGELVFRAGEGGVAGFGDLGVRDPAAALVVPHRVRVTDRNPRRLGDSATDRVVHRHGDREAGDATAGRGYHGAGVERRVPAQQHRRGRARAGADGGGAQRLGHQRRRAPCRAGPPAAQPGRRDHRRRGRRGDRRDQRGQPAQQHRITADLGVAEPRALLGVPVDPPQQRGGCPESRGTSAAPSDQLGGLALLIMAGGTDRLGDLLQRVAQRSQV